MLQSDQLLIKTRSRRQNAGNKMKQLLEQEINKNYHVTPLSEDEINIIFQEDEEDQEYTIDKTKLNHDDIFSDSSDEKSSEESEYHIEDHLQIQRRKKRLQNKKSAAIAKRVKKDYKTKLQYEQPKAESLLEESRRTSKRSSVVRNKMQIYEKLTQAEEKRKLIRERIHKYKKTRKEIKLTQEDRIRMASETEQINLLSLNKYKEQEISKKQTKLAMHRRQHIGFKPNETIITWLSTSTNITPSMEIYNRCYWEGQLLKREKKKKKYPRKKKQDTKVENEKKDDNSNINENCLLNNSIDEINTPPQENGEKSRQSELLNDIFVQSLDKEKPSVHSGKIFVNEGLSNSLEISKSISNICDEQSPNKIVLLPDTPQEINAPVHDLGIKETKHIIKSDNVNITSPESFKYLPNGQGCEEEFYKQQDPKSIDLQTDCEQKILDVEENQEIKTEHEYEGPSQLVGKNFLIISTFPDIYMKGESTDIKTVLFGSQWTGLLNKRVTDMENVGKSIVNKYKDSERSIMDIDLSLLDKFPAFGEYDKKLDDAISIDFTKEIKVEIKTESPSGVYLPNGIRKRCLINNKDCQYFDPKNGVPYADVEAIKIIQEIQDPIGEGTEESPATKYQWFGFGRGGIYLDIRQRPAMGTPEGFF